MYILMSILLVRESKWLFSLLGIPCNACWIPAMLARNINRFDEILPSLILVKVLPFSYNHFGPVRLSVQPILVINDNPHVLDSSTAHLNNRSTVSRTNYNSDPYVIHATFIHNIRDMHFYYPKLFSQTHSHNLNMIINTTM